MFHFIKTYRISIISALVILFLTTVSVSDLPPLPDVPIIGIDKLAHFVVFYFLTTFLIVDIQNYKGFYHKRFIIAAFVVSLVYGGMIELIQHLLFVYRSGSLLDILANITGSLSACIIQYKYKLIKY
jgi:VanZ family protein